MKSRVSIRFVFLVIGFGYAERRVAGMAQGSDQDEF